MTHPSLCDINELRKADKENALHHGNYPNHLKEGKNIIKRYQHTQSGYFIIIPLAIFMLFDAGLMTFSGFNWIALLVLISLDSVWCYLPH
ncbi:MAG: hypothetical protein V2G33_03970 [bacterium JZ-2024 1]